MHIRTYRWSLFGDTNEPIERYCSHCGKKTLFSDSGKIRHNANGKNVFEYAIYKCERDHTWNRMLRTFKAAGPVDVVSVQSESIIGCGNDDNIMLMDPGADEINIILEEVTGKWRLDKLLSERITDVSRNTICKMIETGAIRVDGMLVKPNMNLKKLQVITILPGSECLRSQDNLADKQQSGHEMIDERELRICQKV